MKAALLFHKLILPSIEEIDFNKLRSKSSINNHDIEN